MLRLSIKCSFYSFLMSTSFSLIANMAGKGSKILVLTMSPLNSLLKCKFVIMLSIAVTVFFVTLIGLFIAY